VLDDFQLCFRRQGDISTLEVDAITNSTDESLSEINEISGSILKRSGEQLKQNILTEIKGEWIPFLPLNLNNLVLSQFFLQSAKLVTFVCHKDIYYRPSTFYTRLRQFTVNSIKLLQSAHFIRAIGKKI
jgi:hypothetical protein